MTPKRTDKKQNENAVPSKTIRTIRLVMAVAACGRILAGHPAWSHTRPFRSTALSRIRSAGRVVSRRARKTRKTRKTRRRTTGTRQGKRREGRNDGETARGGREDVPWDGVERTSRGTCACVTGVGDKTWMLLTGVHVVHGAVRVQHGGVTLLVHLARAPQRVRGPRHGGHGRVVPVRDHRQAGRARRDVGQRDARVVVVHGRGRRREQPPPDRRHPPEAAVRRSAAQVAPRFQSPALGERALHARLLQRPDGRLYRGRNASSETERGIIKKRTKD